MRPLLNGQRFLRLAWLDAAEKQLMEALRLAPTATARRRVEEELARLDEAKELACASALEQAPAEVIDLAAARRDRQMLAALRALHLRMDAAEVTPANDTAVAS